ncbi:hypothetical protein LR48_Vigan04g155600 [Vigna angularis]|uniref:Uncharacterized protein n=1 Tax=Phaseolus angularis TaxID=3914 RepID=A0A0L9UF38_PHAAN|nr:hypothetical protein LR48_Vigan04g155600 [Vigna angularis]
MVSNQGIVEHMLSVDVPLQILKKRKDKLAPPHMNEMLKEMLRLKNFSSTLKAINIEIITGQCLKSHEGKILEAKVIASTIDFVMPKLDVTSKCSSSLMLKNQAKKTKVSSPIVRLEESQDSNDGLVFKRPR